MAKKPQAALEDPPMAKKHLPLEVSSSATSSDDTEDENDITDSSSDEEDEPQNPTKQQNPSALVTVVSALKKGPVSDSSSDEEDDPQNPTGRKQQNPSATVSAVKKVSFKDQTPSASVAVSAAKGISDSGESETDSESESETEPPPHLSATAKPKSKRQSEEATTSLNPKRVKIEAETETKKSYFQRLWSEEDEIVILQGMIDFKSKTGKIHSEDMGRFYDFVKKSITYEAKNLNQFINKIHSLKKKFMAKEKKGDKRSFVKPHDEKCFQLSKLIWGMNVQSAVAVVKSKKKIKVESLEPEIRKDEWFENSFLVSAIGRLGMDEETLKKKWSLVPLEMKKKLEEKWKVFEGKELQLIKEKIRLVNELAFVLLH